MIPNLTYQRWFFDGAYVVAGRPKMEAELMHWAREKYLDCLVYETFIPEIVKEIRERQDRLYEQNKRLKKVEISLSKNDSSYTRWLHIGAQHLTLRKVKEEIDYA
jgi:hypothetical protein